MQIVEAEAEAWAGGDAREADDWAGGHVEEDDEEEAAAGAKPAVTVDGFGLRSGPGLGLPLAPAGVELAMTEEMEGMKGMERMEEMVEVLQEEKAMGEVGCSSWGSGGMAPTSPLSRQDGGGDVDYKAARHWFEKAAGQGNADAQSNLGIMLMMGQGGDVDHKAARHWFEKAAEQGNASAQYNLGLMLKMGGRRY